MGHNTLPDPAESQPLACVQSPSVGQTLQLAALLGSPSWYLIYIFPDTLFSGFSNDKTEPDEEKKKRRTWLRARGEHQEGGEEEAAASTSSCLPQLTTGRVDNWKDLLTETWKEFWDRKVKSKSVWVWQRQGWYGPLGGSCRGKSRSNQRCKEALRAGWPSQLQPRGGKSLAPEPPCGHSGQDGWRRLAPRLAGCEAWTAATEAAAV